MSRHKDKVPKEDREFLKLLDKHNLCESDRKEVCDFRRLLRKMQTKRARSPKTPSP